MTLITKYSADVLGWKRKPGPLKVWRVVEGRKKTAEGKTQRFSIQEIPEDRYEDAVNLIGGTMTQDEPISAHLGIFNDPVALADFRKLWSFCLQQGIVVGAFVVDENNPKPVLAGVNMVWVLNAASEEGMNREIKLESPKMQVFMKFMSDLEEEVNVKKFYKVDKYISAYGLCVNRAYRGQGLGYQLLKARDDMAVAYDIEATSTVFTAAAAQKAAANAGFDILIQRDFVDARNERGNEIFPGIPHKTFKLMGKRFS